MANREAFISNFFETTLSSSMGATDLTATVVSTSGAPSSPCYVVIEPESTTQREIIYMDGTFTGTTFVTSGTGNRYLTGSAASSGLTHPSGSVVWVAVLAQNIEDLHDRIDAVASPITTRGDLIRGNASGEGERVALGTTGQVLTSDGTDAVWGGDVNLADNLLTRPKLKDYSEEQTAPSSSAGTLTLNLENGNVFESTLTEATTVAFSNPPATGDAGSVTLILTQDATGSRTITWPASVKWPRGSEPTLSTTANAIDIFTFLTTDAGTTWHGFLAGAGMA